MFDFEDYFGISYFYHIGVLFSFIDVNQPVSELLADEALVCGCVFVAEFPLFVLVDDEESVTGDRVVEN